MPILDRPLQLTNHLVFASAPLQNDDPAHPLSGQRIGTCSCDFGRAVEFLANLEISHILCADFCTDGGTLLGRSTRERSGNSSTREHLDDAFRRTHQHLTPLDVGVAAVRRLWLSRAELSRVKYGLRAWAITITEFMRRRSEPIEYRLYLAHDAVHTRGDDVKLLHAPPLPLSPYLFFFCTPGAISSTGSTGCMWNVVQQGSHTFTPHALQRVDVMIPGRFSPSLQHMQYKYAGVVTLWWRRNVAQRSAVPLSLAKYTRKFRLCLET